MSIYPVNLAEWFPRTHEVYETAKSAVKYMRCHACAKPVRYHKAVGHHSIPWGCGEVWCDWKCCDSNKHKIPKPDRRFERRMNRRPKEVAVLE